MLVQFFRIQVPIIHLFNLKYYVEKHTLVVLCCLLSPKQVGRVDPTLYNRDRRRRISIFKIYGQKLGTTLI